MRQHQTRVRKGETGLHIRPTGPRGGYQYRGKAAKTVEPEAPEQPTIQTALRRNRQALSQAVATIRAISVRRNDKIAEAIWDGIPARTVAVAASTTMTEVRSIRAAFDDVLPSGASANVHVAAIESATGQVHLAEADRDRLERLRDQLIVTAHRLQTCDEYEIAALTGITAEQIRRMTRGTRVSMTQRRSL
jgi:hypothetical protein